MNSNTKEFELRERELELKRQELELERAKLFIDFAKFGFTGTLTAAIAGMGVLVALVVLAAFTAFKIETWALVFIACIIAVGCIAFGYFSLWQLPSIVARFQKAELTVNPTKGG
jgi:hypothetical protein